MESVRLIATMVRLVRDVGLAEDFAQDALVAALAQWPGTGIPANPGAWLLTVAKRRAMDHFRAQERADRRTDALGRELERSGGAVMVDFEAGAEEHIDDDVLRLMFLCCHPLLTTNAQVALTLKLVAGLSTAEIARAYVTSEATIAQRIVRATRTLSDAQVAAEEPTVAERLDRLDAVLQVVYLVFNEGYSATSGTDWMRPMLCAEALRVGRILAALLPERAAVLGLQSLMEIQSSRLAARVDADGAPVLLLDQDRARWDRLLIQRGLSALERAIALDPTDGYVLQAAIAACHARAHAADDTDWRRIADLYAQLARRAGSPIVELNRAVAVSMADGPAAGLAIVDELAEIPAMRRYHLLASVRADLLVRLGRETEARAEFARAAELTDNARERALLLRRAGSLTR